MTELSTVTAAGYGFVQLARAFRPNTIARGLSSRWDFAYYSL